jgi:tetratricopeptide (TPR) repeat protein
MLKLYLLIALIISFINGCSSIDPYDIQESPPQSRVPVEEKTFAEDVVKENAYQPKVITTASVSTNQTKAIPVKKSRTPASRQAVLDLLKQSKSAMDDYRYREAESLLNRALRIEPKNAWLWHNMAVLKFYQKDYQQAIQQALKSSNLERNDQQLRNNNNKVIQQSRLKLKEMN